MKKAAIVIGYDDYGYVKDLAVKLRQRGYLPLLVTNCADKIYSDLYEECLFYSNVYDLNGAAKAIEAFQRKYDVATMICQTDSVFFLYSGLMNMFRVGGTKSFGIYNTKNKYVCRDLLHKSGLSKIKYSLVKNYEDIKDAAECLSFPVVIKPIAGWGSEFVYKICDKTELINKYQWIKGSIKNTATYVLEWNSNTFNVGSDFLVEEYIEGDEFTVDGYVCDESVQIIALHQKIGSTEENGFRDHFYLTPPHNINERTIQGIHDYIKQVIKVVGLKRSLYHIELRIDKKGGFEIIEINSRLGGGSIRNNIINLTGIDMLDILIDIDLGREVKNLHVENKGFAFGVGVIFEKTGILKKINGLEYVRSLPQLKELKVLYPAGSVIRSVEEEIYAVMINGFSKNINEIIDFRKNVAESLIIDMEE